MRLSQKEVDLIRNFELMAKIKRIYDRQDIQAWDLLVSQNRLHSEIHEFQNDLPITLIQGNDRLK